MHTHVTQKTKWKFYHIYKTHTKRIISSLYKELKTDKKRNK